MRRITGVRLLKAAASSVAHQSHHYRGSVYAKWRERLRWRPQMVERFPSVVLHMALVGTEEDNVNIASTTQDILSRAPMDRCACG